MTRASRSPWADARSPSTHSNAPFAALAPVCPHCGVRIVGHGVQHGDTIFCCVHCAKHEGVKGLVDRD
ncbi:MAG: hypothetical protein WBB72_16460 [Methyloceanibacter sp.]